MANPTLSDLDPSNPDSNVQPITPITSGNGDPTPEDLAAQQLAAQKAADDARIAALEAKQDLTPEETEELNKLKGNTPTGDPNDDDDETDEPSEVDPVQFWKEVDKLHGEDLNIEWDKHVDAEGNPIDPLSPEGVLIRDKAIAQRAIDSFERHLEKTDPRAYAYMLHRQSGGTDDDFFSSKTIALPDYTEFSNSVDLQQKVYREDLISKGVSEKQANLLVDQAVKDKEIFELADKAYKSREKEQADKLAAIQRQIEADEKAYQEGVKALTTMLSNEINSGTTMKVVVPEAKKAEFYQYVSSRIQESGGKFLVVQEIEKNSLPRLLEGLYLQFVNGDLTGLIKRAAQTQNVASLRDRLNKDKKKPSSSTPKTGGKLTLGEL